MSNVPSITQRMLFSSIPILTRMNLRSLHISPIRTCTWKECLASSFFISVHFFFTFSSSHSAAVTVQFKEPSHHPDCPVPDLRSRTTWNIAAFARIRFQAVLHQGPSGLRAAEHSFIRLVFKLRHSQLDLIILGQLYKDGSCPVDRINDSLVFPSN